MPERQQRGIIYVIWWIWGICTVVIAIWWWYNTMHQHDGLLQVVVADVGQGNGTYIRTAQGIEVIIDTGATNQMLRQIGQYRPFYDRSIDWIIGSHADRDHIGIMPRMFDRYTIQYTALGPGVRDTALFDALRQQSAASTPVTLSAGQTIALDSDTMLEILHPAPTVTSSGNDQSLVIRLVYGDTSFLIPGDISASVERRLVRNYGTDLQSDVLIVSHHGSKNSSDADFISAVQPRYAVVSAGADNRYGHPHPLTVGRLEYQAVDVYRTDVQGDIVFTSDGQSVTVW